ncbi:MAG: hypothetical protein VKJ44_04865 [Synechococcus sp.]|nr:hypothetical protein [Synechococcus sp.]
MNQQQRRDAATDPPLRLELELPEEIYLHLFCQATLQGCSPQSLAERLLRQLICQRH